MINLTHTIKNNNQNRYQTKRKKKMNIQHKKNQNYLSRFNKVCIFL